MSFIKDKPSPNAFNVWLAFLNQKVGGKVLLDCSLGKGFFMLKLDIPIMVKKLLTLIPFKTGWGLAIFQEWAPSFNVDNPKGMRFPTWITLKKLSVEFRGTCGEIAARLCTMLGFDKVTTQTAEQQFCVALDFRDGWQTSMVVVENEAMGEAVTMLIDYNFLPIRYKFCLKSSHQMKDCSNLANLKEKSMKVGEACMKPYSRGNFKNSTQRKKRKVACGNTHKDGVDHLMLKDHKIGLLKK